MRQKSEKKIYTFLNTQISPFPSDCINEILYYYVCPFIKTSFLKYARHPVPSGPHLLSSSLHGKWGLVSYFQGLILLWNYAFKRIIGKEHFG